MAWGYHLILDCYEGDKDKISNGENITAFAKTLVKRIQMKAYGEPQVIHFGEDDKLGYTLVQLIETSNICAHFANDTRALYLDVFSCKEYDDQVVIRLVKEFFGAKYVRPNYLTRQA